MKTTFLIYLFTVNKTDSVQKVYKAFGACNINCFILFEWTCVKKMNTSEGDSVRKKKTLDKGESLPTLVKYLSR